MTTGATTPSQRMCAAPTRGSTRRHRPRPLHHYRRLLRRHHCHRSPRIIQLAPSGARSVASARTGRGSSGSAARAGRRSACTMGIAGWTPFWCAVASERTGTRMRTTAQLARTSGCRAANRSSTRRRHIGAQRRGTWGSSPWKAVRLAVLGSQKAARSALTNGPPSPRPWRRGLCVPPQPHPHRPRRRTMAAAGSNRPASEQMASLCRPACAVASTRVSETGPNEGPCHRHSAP